MSKVVLFSQFVARHINHDTYNIPKIQDGQVWRNIQNSHLVENVNKVNGHDRYEDAIFRIKNYLEKEGWQAEISDKKEWCHEHLYYQHYRLKCWK